MITGDLHIGAGVMATDMAGTIITGTGITHGVDTGADTGVHTTVDGMAAGMAAGPGAGVVIIPITHTTQITTMATIHTEEPMHIAVHVVVPMTPDVPEPLTLTQET